MSTLVRSEIALAKAEITAEAKRPARAPACSPARASWASSVSPAFIAVGLRPGGRRAAGVAGFLIVAVLLFVVAGVLALRRQEGRQQGPGASRSGRSSPTQETIAALKPATDTRRPRRRKRHRRLDEYRRLVRPRRRSLGAPVRRRQRRPLPRRRAGRGSARAPAARLPAVLVGVAPPDGRAGRRRLPRRRDGPARLRRVATSRRAATTLHLAADVASVIRSLGEKDADVVGQGWAGGSPGPCPTLQPDGDPRGRRRCRCRTRWSCGGPR